MPTIRIDTLGDSSPRGPAPMDAQKYATLLARALRSPATTVSIERVAHSGAVIGDQDSGGLTAPGEVPVPSPTIIEQCADFAKDPGSVNIVLLNGGINDVGVARILNPFAL